MLDLYGEGPAQGGFGLGNPCLLQFDSREPARALAQQDSGPRQPRPTGTAPVAASRDPAGGVPHCRGRGRGAPTPTGPAATPTPAIAVGPRFARVYADRPELAWRLGNPTGAETEMGSMVQSFAGG